jgi:hypothetical protein
MPRRPAPALLWLICNAFSPRSRPAMGVAASGSSPFQETPGKAFNRQTCLGGDPRPLPLAPSSSKVVSSLGRAHKSCQAVPAQLAVING